MKNKSFITFIFESKILYLRISLRKHQIYTQTLFLRLLSAALFIINFAKYIAKYMLKLYNYQTLCCENI